MRADVSVVWEALRHRGRMHAWYAFRARLDSLAQGRGKKVAVLRLPGCKRRIFRSTNRAHSLDHTACGIVLEAYVSLSGLRPERIKWMIQWVP